MVSASALLLALHYFACALWLVLRAQVGEQLEHTCAFGSCDRYWVHQSVVTDAGCDGTICHSHVRLRLQIHPAAWRKKIHVQSICAKRALYADKPFVLLACCASCTANTIICSSCFPTLLCLCQGFPDKTWPAQLGLLDDINVYQCWTWYAACNSSLQPVFVVAGSCAIVAAMLPASGLGRGLMACRTARTRLHMLVGECLC